MNQNLNQAKEGLLKEQDFLQRENSRLEAVIDSQTERMTIKQRLKEIENKLLEINVRLLKSEERENKSSIAD